MFLVNMSVSAFFTILAVIVMRMLFIHKLPKKTFMLLWGLVICRLLLPVSIPSRLSIWNIIGSLGPAKEVPAGNSAGGLSILFWVWLGGFCLCALFFLFSHWRFLKVYSTALPVENDFTRQWIAAHPLRRKLRIHQLDIIETPLTYGVLRPVILLPKTTDWQDETGLTYIFSHEYAHIRHFDTFSKLILAMALSVHWFNPLVWVMYILANRDIELSCDETVVRTHGVNTKSVYALTLLHLAETKSSKVLNLCANFCKNVVEERIVSIMTTKKISFSAVFAAFAIISGITMVFTTARVMPKAPAKSFAAMDSRTNYETHTVSFAAPAEPAVPAAIETIDTPEYTGYRERMLFATEAESDVKVTYDGASWEYYAAATEKETWRWYSYEEYAKYIEILKTAPPDAQWGLVGAEQDLSKHMQTLADIGKGIKVSNRKSIFIANDTPDSIQNQGFDGYVEWYCFGYSFTDQAGNEVDLGIFDTRSELFAALRQYYDNEVTTGTLAAADAERLYSQIAHETRNVDEVPLQEKLNNNKEYNLIGYMTRKCAPPLHII